MNFPKHANLWLPSYLRHQARRIVRPEPARRVWVAITDHYEPLAGNPLSTALGRVQTWQELWPRIAEEAPRDAGGRRPCFTCFYPQEEYRPEILDALAALCKTGTADVEIHIHHDHDTAATFREKMVDFRDCLYERHGLLRRQDGRTIFGFIHGNWALDNSRPDGRWCGVTGELQLLRDLGCYADFTMPSIPSPTQSRILNQIYWTTGDPTRPRGFDSGIQASLGGGVQGDLLMIPGPAGLRFRERRMPRIETGELAHYDPPTRARVDGWLALAPRIGEDIFLKLYGHSAREDNAGALLGTATQPGSLAPMFRWIAEAAAEQKLELRWASAWQMYQAVRALIDAPAGARG